MQPRPDRLAKLASAADRQLERVWSWVAFHVGALCVGVGIKPGGEVEYPGNGLSAAQSAVIAAAGPAADLVTAPLVLVLPIACWAAVYLAVMIAAPGLANLIPAKTGDGSLSDGVKLIRARARSRATAEIRELLAAPDWSHRPATANRLINGWVLVDAVDQPRPVPGPDGNERGQRHHVPAAEECLKQLPDDRDALLRFYAQEWSLPEGPETEFLNIVHALSWRVGRLLEPVTRTEEARALRWEHVDLEGDPDADPGLPCTSLTSGNMLLRVLPGGVSGDSHPDLACRAR